jgi:hypothetical protein
VFSAAVGLGVPGLATKIASAVAKSADSGVGQHLCEWAAISEWSAHSGRSGETPLPLLAPILIIQAPLLDIGIMAPIQIQCVGIEWPG